ncbi:MAG: VCBS repeat-containing protein, partial [Candidatus Thermoplasmatota archaeon]
KDGILDIATGYEGVWVNTSNAGAGDVFVWASNSTGLETSNSYYGVAFGDINNDGNLDLVGAIDEVGGGVRAWTGNGGAGSSMVWTNVTANLPLTGIYTGIYLVDVNCDGNLDIIVGGGHGGAGVWVWTGNGGVGGSFVWTLNSTNLPTGGDYYQVVAGDLNGDGNIDIVAANNSGGGVELWEGNGGVGGSMIWTNNSTDLPVGGCIDVCLGDVNNDGRLDIAAAFDGQGVRVLLNNKPFPNYTYDLREGWNFVTLPLNNTTIKRAGNLAKLVGSNCTTISKWDNFNKQFIVFSITTPAINNFTIEDGAGYLVYVTANTPFTISGALIKKVIHNLYIGWNNIGWFNFTSTYSGDLAQNITNCTAIAYWNTTLGRFVIHPKGTGISDVFTIKRGCGYFVYVTSDVTWVNKG